MWEIWIDLLKIAAGILGALGAVYLKNKLEQKGHVKQTILDKSVVYDQFQSIVHHTDIEGAMVVRSHNGGGVPRVGSRLYLTAVDQLVHPASDFSQSDFKRKYDNLNIDKPFIDLLKQMRMEQSVSVMQEELPDDDLLKGILQNDGIGYLMLFHLCDSKDYMFFIMLIKTTADPITDAGQRARIDVGVDRIRQVYEKSYKNR